MNKKFIYDVKTSKLFAPDGTYLKELHCPKAKHWNQLLVVDGEDRWRHCQECKEKVINLDVCDVESTVAQLKSWWPVTCVHATEAGGRVVFLEDPEPIQPWQATNTEPVLIQTARSVEDINRAAGMGYWPDVRFIEYAHEDLWWKVMAEQCKSTGHIYITADYRSKYMRHHPQNHLRKDPYPDYSDWEEIIPFTKYYPYYQKIPIAAYLIPRGLEDGAAVIVQDPIEDHLGGEWNQGDHSRAMELHGNIRDRRVVLDTSKIEVASILG